MFLLSRCPFDMEYNAFVIRNASSQHIVMYKILNLSIDWNEEWIEIA